MKQAGWMHNSWRMHMIIGIIGIICMYDVLWMMNDDEGWWDVQRGKCMGV